MGFDVVSRRHRQSSASLTELPCLYDSTRYALLEGVGKEPVNVSDFDNDFRSPASPQEALKTPFDGYVRSRQASLSINLTPTNLKPHVRAASTSKIKMNAFGSTDESGGHERLLSNPDFLVRHCFLDPVSSVNYTPFGTPNLTPHSSAKKRPAHLAITPVPEKPRRLSFIGPLPSPSWPYARPDGEGDKREKFPDADMRGEIQGLSMPRVKSELLDSWNFSGIPEASLRPVEASGHTEVAAQREAITSTKTASSSTEKGHSRVASAQPSSYSRRRPHASPQLQQRSQTMYVLDNHPPQPRVVLSAQFLQSIPAQSPHPLALGKVNFAPSLPQYCRDSSWGPNQYLPSDPRNHYSLYDPIDWPPLDLRPVRITEPRLAFSSTSSCEPELYKLPLSPQPQSHRLSYQPSTDGLAPRSSPLSLPDGTALYHPNPHPDPYSHQHVHREMMRVRSTSLPPALLSTDDPYNQRTPQRPDIRAARQFLEFYDRGPSNDRPHSAPRSPIMPSPLQGQGRPQRPRTQSFHQPPSHSPLGHDSPPPMPAIRLVSMLLSRVRTSTSSRSRGEPLTQRRSSFFAKALKKKNH